MRHRLAGLAAIVGSLLVAEARADEILNVGDAAPKLAVSSWAKGEKVESFEPGKVYVVEFWATWCGPCRATIPHLTELAHKYKDKGVRFIGVDVYERDTSLVEPFLKEMGDKMDYSVALDDVPKGGEVGEGAMAKTWMTAAAEDGIPTAFVVRDGKIAWIGHPMGMDEPLAKIVSGSWDFADMAKARLEAKAKERKAAAVQMSVYTPYRARDYKATLAAIEEVATSDAEVAEQFDTIKFTALCCTGQVDAGLALGEKLYEANRDSAPMLNNLAWQGIDPALKAEPDPRVARFALKAARRSVELSKGEDMANLDTLSLAQFLTGDVAGAIETEEKALKVLEGVAKNKSHPYFKEFNERLDMYRKAASAKASGE